MTAELFDVPAGWKLTYNPATEWFPQDENHPARKFVKSTYAALAVELEVMPPEVWRVGIPVLYVDDAKGEMLKHVELEARLEREVPGDPNTPHAATSKLFLIQRPQASTEFEKGDMLAAMKSAIPATTPLHAQLFLKARAQFETEAAMNAFEMLFQHYSFNEELWRLEQLMEILPFDLEEHPRMERLRQLLEKQIGHLREDVGPGQRRITALGLHRWYSKGSPIAGVDVTYVKMAKLSLPPRFSWLVDECKQRGYRNVAEFGSVEGISLFHLIHHAPEISWHGFESSDVAVARGNALAAEASVLGNFNLHTMRDFGRTKEFSSFDAVALFELLEHNTFDAGMQLVHRCMKTIRVGGSLFITTPCGNWSAFDLHTRDVELAKDHINAFTPKRMTNFLRDCVKFLRSDDGWEVREVREISNPNIAEANSWVFARLERVR